MPAPFHAAADPARLKDMYLQVLQQPATAWYLFYTAEYLYGKTDADRAARCRQQQPETLPNIERVIYDVIFS